MLVLSAHTNYRLDLLGEVAVEIKCTSYCSQLRESSDILQHSVVRDLVAGVD